MPLFLIYGTFMSDQPGHANLGDAQLLEVVATAPRYRLWEVDGRWPALIEDEDGVEIAGELYELSAEQLARTTEAEPPGWHRDSVVLADGRLAEAFVGDPAMKTRGVDVSAFGGWAAYLAHADRNP